MSTGCSPCRTRRPASPSSWSTSDGENVIAVAGGANTALDLGPGPVRASSDSRSARATSSSSGTRSGPGPPTRRCAWVASPGATTILNPAPAAGLGRSTLELADILTPNEGELAMLAGPAMAVRPRRSSAPGPDPGGEPSLVSLGSNGRDCSSSAGDRRPLHAPRVEVVDTVGAGDTLNGALAAGLAAGLDLPEAARRAVVAAVVGRHPRRCPRRDAECGRARCRPGGERSLGRAGRPPRRPRSSSPEPRRSSRGSRRRSPTRPPARALSPRRAIAVRPPTNRTFDQTSAQAGSDPATVTASSPPTAGSPVRGSSR